MGKYYIQVCPHTEMGRAYGGAECSVLDGEVSSLIEAIESAYNHFNGEERGSVAYIYHRQHLSSEVVASVSANTKKYIVCLP